MKSVILNMMIMGIVSGLIGGEASAISFGFGKSKSKVQEVQQEETSSVKNAAKKTKDAIVKAAKKTKDFSVNAVKKTKDSLVKTKESIKTSYQKSKEQRREKAHQKGLAEEGKPFNTMFVSKSDIEYNLKYLNDVHKSLKSSASSIEKVSSSLESAFVAKSLLFEISIYVRLCEKFSKQYLEGMNKLKKSKAYDDADYARAMDIFENAHETVRYETTQKSLISHVQGLISEKNLRDVSKEEASNILKKVKKLSENLKQLPENTTKLKNIVKTIDDQTLDKESSFGYLEKGMLDHVQNAADVMEDIPDMLKKVSKIVQNHIDEFQE